MQDPTTRNLTWHPSRVDAATREARLGQRGGVVWLTGLSGSGKSTLAVGLEQRLVERGRFAYVLDGDNLRHGLNADLGFGERDRQENIRRVGEVARLFADAGAIVVTAFISPFRADRDGIRARLPVGAFLEVHVATPLEVCEARDPKGLYRRARAGEVADFTGISSPYEPPVAPELILSSAELGPEAGVDALEGMLAARGWLGRT